MRSIFGTFWALMVVLLCGPVAAGEHDDIAVWVSPGEVTPTQRWPDQFATMFKELRFFSSPEVPYRFVAGSAKVKDDGLVGFIDELNRDSGAYFRRPAAGARPKKYHPVFSGVFQTPPGGHGKPPTWQVKTEVLASKIGVTQDHDLWWFNRLHPTGYDITATLTVVGGQTTGEYKWKVIAGTDKIDLRSGGQTDGDEMTTSSNTITIVSTLPSAPGDVVQKDVLVQVKHRGDKFDFPTVVLAPNRVVMVRVPPAVNSDPAFDSQATELNGVRMRGFHTRIVLEVQDQFKRRLPRDLPMNEMKTGWTNLGNNNWIQPDDENWSSTNSGQPPEGTARFTDHFEYAIPLGPLPPPALRPRPLPVVPGWPDEATLVAHCRQRYFAGSSDSGQGVQVSDHRLEYRRGFARLVGVP
jgi:hypothetical protein